MPCYEYQCEACGHKLEEIQKFSDEPLKRCPKCDKNKLRRLISVVAGIIFKGSGFYQTDYGGKNASFSGSKNGEKL